jgi:hypothetical protein
MVEGLVNYGLESAGQSSRELFKALCSLLHKNSDENHGETAANVASFSD